MMDVSKMYCRVDSDHFDEFVKLVGEQFGYTVADSLIIRSRTKSAVEVAIIGDCLPNVAAVYADESGHFSKCRDYTEFTGSWSIYNNTKPLSELTDQQAVELFNWWRKGGKIQVELRGSWRDKVLNSKMLTLESIYRAKPKSERELFIEAADYFIDCGDDASVIAGKMFDAGFEAPKGGD